MSKHIRIALSIFFALWATSAAAQSVLQSGTVTPGHATKWISNGVIGDAGTAANGLLSSIGVTNAGGPGICVASAAQTAAGRNQLCLSASTSGVAKISLQNYGTATAQNLQFDINGNTIDLPSVPGSTFATISGPFTNGDIACVTGAGALYDCGFSGGLIPGAGTSGGIPYYSAPTTLSSSALLAADKIVLGGGAGTAPATTANAGMSAGALTLGQAGSVLGSVVLSGSTSGAATIVPQVAAGTPTITLPNASGTVAVSGTAPIVLSATTGALTCPTCVTSSGGGAITGTAPISVSAAGVVSITGTALTKTDDTNVTLTLGGAPTTALVTAASITAGWTGQLALTRGGTAANLTASNGGLVYSTASAFAILSGTATAGQIPRSGSSAAPSWSTATYPSTAAAGTVLAAATANVIAATETPTLGANGGTGGQVTFNGSTSGSAILKVAAAAGSVTFQLPSTNGASGEVLQTNGSGVTSWVAAAGGGTVTSVAAGTGMSFSTITGSGSVAIDKATAANLEAGASNKVLTSDIIYDAEVAITYAASLTLDFNTFLNGRVTLTGNVTSLTCSNIKASQSGTITWVQDGTGTRTMVAGWCSQFRWAGGSRGVLSTAINTIDALFYQCISTSVCYVSLAKAQAN